MLFILSRILMLYSWLRVLGWLAQSDVVLRFTWLGIRGGEGVESNSSNQTQMKEEIMAKLRWQ